MRDKIMNYQWISPLVSAVLGGGLVWKLRSFAAPGPNISLTSWNTARDNHEYPRLLEVENFGDKVAQGLAWEIRDYDIAWLPNYQSQCGRRLVPLKPGESFFIDVGSSSAGVAFLSDFEIIISYMGPNRAKFFSHFTVDGSVKRFVCGRGGFSLIFAFASPLECDRHCIVAARG
jgi:hypothetical protein